MNNRLSTYIPYQEYQSDFRKEDKCNIKSSANDALKTIQKKPGFFQLFLKGNGTNGLLSEFKYKKGFDSEAKFFGSINTSYITSSDGGLAVCDNKHETMTMWQDKDGNGKFETKIVYDMHDDGKNKAPFMNADPLKGKKGKIIKLDEKKSDINVVRQQIFTELEKQEKDAEAKEKAIAIKKEAELQEELAKVKPNIDGKIGNFSQGKTGNCWALGGTQAYSQTDIGGEEIKKSISQDKNGNVIVKLNGVDEQDTIPPKTLMLVKGRLSTGDDDIRAIELAVEKHRKKLLIAKAKQDKKDFETLHYMVFGDEKSYIANPQTNVGLGTLNNPSDGGIDNEMFALLTKRKTIRIGDRKEYRPMTDGRVSHALQEKEKRPKDIALTASFNKDLSKQIFSQHEYAVKSVNKDYVILNNPWNSSEDIKMARQDFMKYYKGLGFVDLASKN